MQIGKNRIKFFDRFFLVEKGVVIDKMKDEFGDDRIKMIKTKELIKNCTVNQKPPSKWAINTREILKYPDSLTCYFTYIKFAHKKNNEEENYGIVGAKSSFGKRKRSDVQFYNVNEMINYKKKRGEIALAAKYMKNHKLEWDTDEILVLKNIEPTDKQEALDNEKKIQAMFALFD